jgi:rfaE bifunctional protein nucleotidyltransferase chain/domain
MNKIINLEEAQEISENLRKKNKSIVIVGGCFDILHVGHIRFLKKAKKTGDFLFILLESDKTTKKLKGEKRPINTQSDRAEILASLSCVDYVVSLNDMNSNRDYDEIVYKLKPDVIAITKNDPQEIHNKRQAKKINAKVVYVISRIENKSTSKLAEIISKNFDK